METKICKDCNETKPLDQFSKDKTRPDGSKRRCRACDKAYMATYLPAFTPGHLLGTLEWSRARYHEAALAGKFRSLFLYPF